VPGASGRKKEIKKGGLLQIGQGGVTDSEPNDHGIRTRAEKNTTDKKRPRTGK